nr:PAS domain-containing sensor histidine kinase [Carboxylicivirga marina]
MISINIVKLQNKRNREQDLKYKALFDNSVDGICVLDKNKKIIDANNSLCEIFKYPIDELVGMNVSQLLHPEDLVNSKSFFKKLHSDGFYSKFEGRVIRKDQSTIWIQVNSTSFSNKKIESGSLDIIRDITKRKKNENYIKQRNQLLQQLNHTKDRFFSIIAHDLRSPFQGILGLNELLKKNFDSRTVDKNKELLTSINEQCNNYYSFLEDLLKWSSLQTDRTSFEPACYSVNDILNEQIELVKHISTQKSIRINSQFNHHDFNVVADKNMLALVFRNMLTNSLKYTPQDGNINIEGTHLKNEESVKIKISDTGIGMQPEQIQQLFKLDKLNSTRGISGESGHGLGLILCKECIEKHGSELMVESSPNKGTCLSFYLPLAN